MQDHLQIRGKTHLVRSLRQEEARCPWFDPAQLQTLTKIYFYLDFWTASLVRFLLTMLMSTLWIASIVNIKKSGTGQFLGFLINILLKLVKNAL